MSYRLVLSDEVDRKAISKDEANLKFAQFRSGLATEAMQRQAVEAQAASQRAVGAAALMSAMKPAPRPSTNCTSVAMGNTVSTNCY
jgi:hypothetical protein